MAAKTIAFMFLKLATPESTGLDFSTGAALPRLKPGYEQVANLFSSATHTRQKRQLLVNGLALNRCFPCGTAPILKLEPGSLGEWQSAIALMFANEEYVIAGGHTC
jgi:hypothetical protein